MATIRKRGTKWQVQVRRKGSAPLSQSFHRRPDALEWARHMEATADRRGLPVDLRVLEQLTVADVLKRYRDTVVPHKRGCEVETIILNAFLRQRIAKTRLSELSGQQFASYRDERLKAVKAATINRELGVFQHAFNVAMKEWNIPLSSNPLSDIQKPKPDRPRERRLQDGEWEKLIKGTGKCRNTHIRPLICFALETGMRRGEILNARWQDLNWGQCTLHIPVTKNGHPRTIPLSSKALAVLSELHGDKGEELRMFPTSIDALKQAWRRLVKRAGVKGLRFHDLRHEAISRFFELGLSVPEVALISGHKDIRMLFRYTHLRAEDVAKKME